MSQIIRLSPAGRVEKPYQPDGKPKPRLTRKAVRTLVTRLRPLVHVNGAASNDSHTEAEDAAIGRELRKWWDEVDLDEHGRWPRGR